MTFWRYICIYFDAKTVFSVTQSAFSHIFVSFFPVFPGKISHNNGSNKSDRKIGPFYHNWWTIFATIFLTFLPAGLFCFFFNVAVGINTDIEEFEKKNGGNNCYTPQLYSGYNKWGCFLCIYCIGSVWPQSSDMFFEKRIGWGLIHGLFDDFSCVTIIPISTQQLDIDAIWL